jgi:hypothetical protein
MKIQSLVLATMFAFIGTTMAYTSAFAEAPATVTATCKDGTSFSGSTKKGACSGHKGVKEWGDTKAAAPTPAAAPSAPAAKTPEKATATPAKPTTSTPMAAAPGGGAGKVWVNSKSKTYHCQGTAYYGKTKVGSYMTETEAKAAGNHADHGKACS